MRIDWDAYERNLLPAAEMAEVMEALKRDADLRAQYHAFQNFKLNVRSSVKSESVPLDQLRQELRVVANQSRIRPAYGRWVTVGVAGSALLVALVARQQFDSDPLRLAKTPEIDQVSPLNESEGWRWIQKEQGYAGVSPIQFKNPNLKFSLVRKGEDWACMDYILDGDPIRLYMKKDESALRNVAFQSVGNRYVFAGNGIGWRSGSFVYSMQGASNEKLLSLVRQAS